MEENSEKLLLQNVRKKIDARVFVFALKLTANRFARSDLFIRFARLNASHLLVPQ